MIGQQMVFESHLGKYPQPQSPSRSLNYNQNTFAGGSVTQSLFDKKRSVPMYSAVNAGDGNFNSDGKHVSNFQESLDRRSLANNTTVDKNTDM